MRLKKITAALLSVGLMVISFTAYALTDTIELSIGKSEMVVNGKILEIDPGRDTTPVIRDGRTLVPIRSVIESMGGTVEWIADENKVILKLKENEIKLIINSSVATLNGKESKLDVAPAIINERTMLPIRFIAESFKFNVDWNELTSTVIITREIPEDDIYNTYIEEIWEEDTYDENLFEEKLWEEDYNEEDFEEDAFYEEDFFEEDFFDEEI